MTTPTPYTRPDPFKPFWGLNAEPILLTTSNAVLGFHNANLVTQFAGKVASLAISDKLAGEEVRRYASRLFGRCAALNFGLGALLGGLNAFNQGKSREVIAYEFLSEGFCSGVGANLAFIVATSLMPSAIFGMVGGLAVSAAANYLLKGGADALFYSAVDFAFGDSAPL